MDQLKKTGHRIRTQSAAFGLLHAFPQQALVAVGLENGDSTFLLISSHLSADTHPLTKKVHELAVYLVDVAPKVLKLVALLSLGIADDEGGKNLM